MTTPGSSLPAINKIELISHTIVTIKYTHIHACTPPGVIKLRLINASKLTSGRSGSKHDPKTSQHLSILAYLKIIFKQTVEVQSK